MTRARWLAVVVLLILAIFAYSGGNFSQQNYAAVKREEIAKQQRVIDLTRDVDSLTSYRDSLRTSPMVQERVAREQWGWARPGEIAFSVRALADTGGVPVDTGQKP